MSAPFLRALAHQCPSHKEGLGQGSVGTMLGSGSALLRPGTLLSLMLGLTLALGACAPVVSGHAPVARPVGDPLPLQSSGPVTDTLSTGSLSTGIPQVSVRTDAAMTAPLEAIFSVRLPPGGHADWQFSDGAQAGSTQASGAEVSHTFYAPGHYTVQARIQAGGREYLATVPLDVRSAGPEQAAAVLLQDVGSLALSAQGSVVYAPYTARFTLDDRAALPGKQSLSAGTHRVGVSIDAPSGALTRSYSVRSRAALSAAEVSRQAAAEAEVLRLTNQARRDGWNCLTHASGGPALSPLRPDPQLKVAARAQSVGMALNGYFAHRSAVDGSLPDARMRASGYRPVADAENIAAGQPTPQDVVKAWLHSPTHCPNIMGDYEDVGVAYMHQDDSPYRDYWTQVFGKK